MLADIERASTLAATLDKQSRRPLPSAYGGFLVPRSLQLDSLLIDGAMTTILREHFLKVFVVEGGSTGLREFADGADEEADGAEGSPQPHRPRPWWAWLSYLCADRIPTWRATYQDELVCGLRLALFKATVWDRGATLGDRLQNLAYQSAAGASTAQPLPTVCCIARAPNRLQKVLLCVISILLPYLLEKLRQRAQRVRDDAVDPDAQWESRALVWAERAERAVAVLEIVNFVAFIGGARYRSLVERVLCLFVAAGQQRTRRLVSLQLMDQRVEWTARFAFIQLLLRVFHVQSALRAAARLGRSAASSVTSLVGVNTGDGQALGGGQAAGAGRDRCHLCGRSPMTLPRTAPCGHTFCYYCAASRLDPEDDSAGFACPRCGADVARVTIESTTT